MPRTPATLLSAFDTWLAAQRAQGRLRHDSSEAVYRAMWQALVAWCVAQRPPVRLRALDAATLANYLASRSGMAGPQEPLTTRYQWRLLSLVQRVQVDHALRAELPPQQAAAELIRRRPALRQANVPLPDELPAHLSDTDALALTQLLTRASPAGDASAMGTAPKRWQTLRDHAAAGLQLGAGLGPGELRMLRLADVELLASRSPALPWRVQVPANGSAPSHTVPVSGWAARLLGRWLQRRSDEALAGNWLFPSTRSGKPWGKVAQFESARRVLAEAGITTTDGGSFRLRHTYALQRLKAGDPPDQVARHLGVVDPSVMARYQRVLDADATALPASPAAPTPPNGAALSSRHART